MKAKNLFLTLFLASFVSVTGHSYYAEEWVHCGFAASTVKDIKLILFGNIEGKIKCRNSLGRVEESQADVRLLKYGIVSAINVPEKDPAFTGLNLREMVFKNGYDSFLFEKDGSTDAE